MSQWLRSLAEVERLRGEWNELQARCRETTPFQSPAWLLPWARHFAPDRLQAIAIRRQGALAAFAPFFIWRNHLLLAGTGPTDYCDGLFADDASAEQTLGALARCADDLACDCVDLQQLRATSRLLRARSPTGWQSAIEPSAICPVTSLADGNPDALMSRKFRTNTGNAIRRLARDADFHLLLTTAPLFDGAAEMLTSLHAARWRSQGQEGVLADDLMRPFLVSVLTELSGAGTLRLHTLHVGERAIAAVFCIHAHDITCFYISGFDPQWARYSPGNITLAAALRHAAAEATREFHFLRGAEPYKYRLGAQDRCTYRRVLRRSS